MAPESRNANVNANIPSGQTVAVPKPENGAAIAVDSSPAGTLELSFDPSSATATRDGNSLVFEVDGGGRVTLNDFFVVGDESLPNLRLPDGTVVASADFFEGSDLDMSTAAGPGSRPNGSGTNYSDDAGILADGLDRLGSLGTDFWGLARTTGDFQEGLDNGLFLPGGSFTLGDLGGIGLFTLRVAEDAKPNQWQLLDASNPSSQRDDTIVATPINLDFQPTAGSSVGAVVLSGFPPGTQIISATRPRAARFWMKQAPIPSASRTFPARAST